MIVWHTIVARWWALAFIPIFFWAARGERSWCAALRFYVLSAVVSFAAEYASTHTGFPYGRYAYETVTRGRELFVSNVPLFVPLTFGVVVWAGRAVARRLTADPMPLIVAGAVVATLIDMAIDPMTVRGEQWFLGHLYTYARPEGFFNVPWSNFAGWLLASAVIIGVDAAFDRRPGARTWRGAALAVGTCAFFTGIGIVARHEAIPATAAGITIVLAVLSFKPSLWRAPRRPRGTTRSLP